MFDIGWSELLVVAVVLIIVVGPKDLPGMLRTFGRTMNQVRRTANDFKRQFNDALEEAEAETGLKETTDQIKSIGSIDPTADLTKGLEDLKETINVDDTPPAIPAAPPAEPDKVPEKSGDDQVKKSGSDAA